MPDQVPTPLVQAPIDLGLVAAALGKLLTFEPQLVALLTKLGPMSKILPPPFNVLSDPVVQAAISALPQLMPILTELQQLLAAAAAVSASAKA